jgi:cytochrome c peroxidase
MGWRGRWCADLDFFRLRMRVPGLRGLTARSIFTTRAIFEQLRQVVLLAQFVSCTLCFGRGIRHSIRHWPISPNRLLDGFA